MPRKCGMPYQQSLRHANPLTPSKPLSKGTYGWLRFETGLRKKIRFPQPPPFPPSRWSRYHCRQNGHHRAGLSAGCITSFSGTPTQVNPPLFPSLYIFLFPFTSTMISCFCFYRSDYLYVSKCYDELNMVDPIVNKCNALWCRPQLTVLFWVVLDMYCNSPNC